MSHSDVERIQIWIIMAAWFSIAFHESVGMALVRTVCTVAVCWGLKNLIDVLMECWHDRRRK